MSKITQSIKATLMLSALSLCWQVGSLAMEKEPVTMDGKVEIRGLQLLATHGELINTSEDDLPPEMYYGVLRCLDPSRDINTRLALMATCKLNLVLGITDYEKENQKKKHFSLQNVESFYDSTLFVLQERLLNILGLYSNIVYYGMGNEIDRMRFQHLCNQFLEFPLFSKTSVPMRYVGILKVEEDCDHLAAMRRNEVMKGRRNNAKQTFISDLLTLINQNPTLQTEKAIHLHFCQFVEEASLEELNSLKATVLYKSLDCSHMKVLNPELLTLKETPGLSGVPQFAMTWTKIIDLEPGVTTFQLHYAASAYFQAGESAEEWDSKAANYAKSAEYCEKLFEVIRALGQKVTTDDFDDAVDAYCKQLSNAEYAYFQAGESAKDWDSKAENFAKSAEYCEKRFKVMAAIGQEPTADDFDWAVWANSKVAYYTPSTKLNYDVLKNFYTKSLEYCQKKLEAIKASGEQPTPDDFKMAAGLFERVGRYSVDDPANAIPISNLTKSAKYFERYLEAIEAADQDPTAVDFETVAKAFDVAGLHATDPAVKVKFFKKCAVYWIKYLNALINSSSQPEPSDYYQAADAYVQIGNYTLDLTNKVTSYIKAKKYYELGLNPEIKRNRWGENNDREAKEQLALISNNIAVLKELEKKLRDITLAEQNLTRDYFYKICWAYFDAGQSVSVPIIKAEFFAKYSEFAEKGLQALISSEEEPTGEDYEHVAVAFATAGSSASILHIKAEFYAKSAEFREKELKAIIDSGKKPADYKFDSVADACVTAGKHAVNPIRKAEFYAKSAEIKEMELEAIIASEKKPTTYYLANAASIFARAGKYAVDPNVKHGYLAKSTDISEKKLETIIVSGKKPTEYDLADSVSIFARAGKYAVDPIIKDGYLAKSTDLSEQGLEAIIGSGKKPTEYDFKRSALIFKRAGKYVSDPASKVAFFSKSAGYIEKQFEAMIDSGHRLSPYDFENAADAYYRASLYATDATIRATSYSYATKYFKLALEEGIHWKHVDKIKVKLAWISKHTANAA